MRKPTSKNSKSTNGETIAETPICRRDSESQQTMASTLFETIRSDIMRGDLAPGARLKIQELVKRYSAGAIPVREALSRLTTSGFVDAKDQRGFSVRQVSASELLDLNRMRQLLESIAVRDSIEQGNLAWEAHVISAHHQMSRLNQFSEFDFKTLNVEWEAAHDEFHKAIVSACSSPWLLKFIEVIRLQSARYRHISVRAKPTAERDVKGEHKSILDSVLERNADLAIEKLCAHFTKSATNALTEGLVSQGLSTSALPIKHSYQVQNAKTLTLDSSKSKIKIRTRST